MSRSRITNFANCGLSILVIRRTRASWFARSMAHGRHLPNRYAGAVTRTKLAERRKMPNAGSTAGKHRMWIPDSRIQRCCLREDAPESLDRNATSRQQRKTCSILEIFNRPCDWRCPAACQEDAFASANFLGSASNARLHPAQQK